MPLVELCAVCFKKIEDKDDWVILEKEYRAKPRSIAHATCADGTKTEGGGIKTVKLVRG